MGKGTDKLYITHSEWSSVDGSQFGGSLGFQGNKANVPFRKLPYNYCALSLQPYTHPVVTRDGTCFDLMNIVPWLKKHGTNPVTGEKMAYSELVKLTMLKNEDGEYCDPVTFKPFTESTHIVAIGTSGNVYAWDTIHRLNIKAKNWNDLLTDDEFTRKDLITIQDPKNLDARDMSKFKYLQDGTSTLTDEQEAERANPLSNINLSATGSSAKILAAKAAVEKARLARGSDPNLNPALARSKPSANQATAASYAAKKALPANAAIYTTGKAAASLTSTSVTPHTSAERAILSEEDYLLRPKKVAIKGYARIVTNMGNLNIELQTEFAPRAVYNFIKLAQRGYYKNTIFHRNIKKFMIQGGDPTGTGKGGQSCWGTNFKDELEGPLLHNARGIISMANKGKNTNSSQFFITYAPTPHLDRKHTIFAKVVGGLDILDRMEKVPSGEGDRPVAEIIIQDVVVFVDPFEEFKKKEKEEEEGKRREEEVRKAGGREDDRTTWTGKRLRADGTVEQRGGSGGVGKYLKAGGGIKQDMGPTTEGGEVVEERKEENAGEVQVDEYYEEPVKKKVKKGGFGNFDGW